MKCPQCGFDTHRVLETRMQREGDIRRRRECLRCKARFSTVESLVVNYPYIKKRDGVKEPFDPAKLKKGIQLACLKRPVGLGQIDDMVHRISRKVLDKSGNELSSIELGHLVMQELKSVDDVAYVRFASVYKTFKDVHEFVQTLESDHQA